MSELATIARPYARAAFEHAHTGAALGAWASFLTAAAAVAADPRVAGVLGDPRLAPQRAVALILNVVAADGIEADAGQRNFLGLLAEGRRLAALPEIAAQFAGLKAEVENTVEVDVVSAIALTPEQRRRLSEALSQRFRRVVHLSERVDPTLIGGAVVRAGDLVIDGSLKSRVEALATQMVRD